MWKTGEGSTGRLVQLCLVYFLFYVITGVTVKYFTGSGMPGVAFLVYSTIGGTAVCLGVALARRWYRLRSNGMVRVGGLAFPREYLYIVPSGVCTAVVIPTTTLMYTLPISVMVAMVMMRGSVIVIGRAVDAIQIRQGILKKRVYWQEDMAVVFAVGAVAVDVLFVRDGGFDFVKSKAALAILGSYIVSYAIRIYIMNYYKNTRAAGVALDNQGFFAVEQIAASVTMVAVACLLYRSSLHVPQVEVFRGAFSHPAAGWRLAVLAGTAYGMVAFFSVFIFMFKGRTATFAGLVNRLTSLCAGTAATLAFWLLHGGDLPKRQDWASLGFILVAVGFLTVAERRRAAEVGRIAVSTDPPSRT